MWSHFNSKEELFVAVVDSQSAILEQAIDDVVVTQSYSLDGLERYCHSYLRALLRPSTLALYRIIIGEGERFPGLNTIFYKRGPAKAISRLTEFIAMAAARKDAEQLAVLVNTALWGWRSHVLTNPSPTEEEDTTNFIASLITRLCLPKL